MNARVVACLALASFVGCRAPGPGVGPEPAPSSTEIGAAAVAASTEAAASPPATEAALDDEAPWPAEPLMDAFLAALGRRCDVPGGDDGTTTQMAEAQRQSASCARAELDAKIPRLPPRAQAAFAKPAAPATKKKPVFDPSSAFDRLLEGGCGVSDTVWWVHGAKREAGTIRHISTAGCGGGIVARTLFVVDAWERGDAKAVAASVGARAPLAKRVVGSFAAAHAGATRLRALAPDDLVFDDECMACTLTDADWRRFDQRLTALEIGSKTLADDICGGWSELTAELGGADSCRAAVTADLELVGAFRRLPDFSAGVTAADYAAERPARDADARRVLEPVVEACWKDESLRYSSDVFDASALACLRASGSSPPALEAAWRRFEATTCDLEALAADGAATLAVYDRHTRYGGSAAVRKTTCPLAMAADRVVFERLAADDPAGLARHVASGAAWASRVRAGADALAATAARPTCSSKWERSTATCRTASLSAAEWARLAKAKASFEAAARALAVEACRVPGAPTDACVAKLTPHFVARATFLGLAAQP